MRLFDTLTHLVQLNGTSVSLAGNLCVLAKKFIEGLFIIIGVIFGFFITFMVLALFLGLFCVLCFVFCSLTPFLGGEKNLSPYLTNTLNSLKDSEDKYCFGLYKKLSS